MGDLEMSRKITSDVEEISRKFKSPSLKIAGKYFFLKDKIPLPLVVIHNGMEATNQKALEKFHYMPNMFADAVVAQSFQTLLELNL